LVGQNAVNPVLNTRVYLAEFPDGHIQEPSANNVIQAIYSERLEVCVSWKDGSTSWHTLQ